MKSKGIKDLLTNLSSKTLDLSVFSLYLSILRPCLLLPPNIHGNDITASDVDKKNIKKLSIKPNTIIPIIEIKLTKPTKFSRNFITFFIYPPKLP
jgi:hypothetical protein